MYIFRWNDEYSGLEVWPSKHLTQKEVWDWAILWLRPAGEKDDKKAETDLRAMGKVVKVQP